MKTSALERLPSYKLDELLQGELNRDDPDGDLVRRIIQVLEEREKDQPVEITPQIQAAWDRLQSNGRTDRRKPTARSWVIRVASMAAMLCVMLTLVIPQPARAETWWEKLARWTDSMFEFASSGTHSQPEYVFQTDNPGLQEVHDAVTELGVTTPVVPMWIPDGFELVECIITPTPAKTDVYAVFQSEQNEFTYKLVKYKSNASCIYQKDDTNVVERDIFGTVHSILQNNEKTVSIWAKNNIECMISTSCDQDILFEVLWSIYSMEEN